MFAIFYSINDLDINGFGLSFRIVAFNSAKCFFVSKSVGRHLEIGSGFFSFKSSSSFSFINCSSVSINYLSFLSSIFLNVYCSLISVKLVRDFANKKFYVELNY